MIRLVGAFTDSGGGCSEHLLTTVLIKGKKSAVINFEVCI
jgi:hypothetical protein